MNNIYAVTENYDVGLQYILTRCLVSIKRFLFSLLKIMFVHPHLNLKLRRGDS